ncbi:MAG: hypothetical protein RBU37_07170 [Myxococcota bacterium]|nr:hypothetical protein [Myxococcota bacterium]
MKELMKAIEVVAEGVRQAKWSSFDTLLDEAPQSASKSAPAAPAPTAVSDDSTLTVELHSRRELADFLGESVIWVAAPLLREHSGWLNLQLRLVGTKVRELTLRCYLSPREQSQWRHGRELLRLRPDAASYKRLFVALCRLSWTRCEPDLRARTRIDEAVFCLIPSTGMRFEAKLGEVSAAGAFLCVDPLLIAGASERRALHPHESSSGVGAPERTKASESERRALHPHESSSGVGALERTNAIGEAVRFRRLQDMTWHSAEVRWQGRKHQQLGVGLALSFAHIEDKDRWSRFVGAVSSAPS